MTLPASVRWGLWASLVLIGAPACGEKEDDTGSDDSVEGDADADSDADTDTDSDSDSDSDTDANVFEDYAVFMNFRLGHIDGSMTAYGYIDEDGAAQEVTPYVEMTFAEEDYFDTGDERYTCTWYGYVVENSLDNLGVDPWIGWDVSFLFIDTDCENFDEEIWGEGTPTTLLESAQFGIGFGEMDSDLTDSFKAAVEDAGYDWEADYEPYLFGMYLAPYDDEVGGLAGGQVNIAYAYELDEDGMLTYDGDDNLIAYDITGTDEMPSPAFVYGPAWFGYYTTIFTE